MRRTYRKLSKLDITYFSLIELLVVISIVALLVSMLMPALKSARDSAKKTQCLNNLKSIGSCVLFYVDDYDDWLPASYYGGWLWFRAPEFIRSYAGAYKKDDDIVKCPSYKGLKHGGNYGLSENWFQNTSMNKPWHRLKEIRRPTETGWAMDIMYEGNNIHSTEQFYTGASWVNRHYRHHNQLDLLYADGHTDSTNEILSSSSGDTIWSGQ